MYRITAYLALTTACVAAALAGLQFADVVSRQDTVTAEPPVSTRPAAQPAPSEAAEETQLVFLPIFGDAPVEVAQPSVEQAVEQPLPDYALTGVIASGATRWAFIEGADGKRVVREGERLDDGTTVRRIASDGVELAVGEGTYLLAFSDMPTTATAPERAMPELAAAAAETPVARAPHRKMIGSVSMSRDDVLAMVDTALKLSRSN